MIKPTPFSAKLTEKQQLTHDVFQFTFTLSEGEFTYQAGHFVMIVFKHEDKIEQRAYSISSRPQTNSFDLCIKLIPDGKGSTFFAQCKIGDLVDFKGPFGMFLVKPENKADLLLIATGTGIAPIKSIAQDLASQNDPRNIKILFGVRYPSDVFYQKELEELAQQPNIQTIITCSQPTKDPQSKQWTGATGRVTDHLNLEDKTQHIYICGNGHMVKDIRTQALESGFEKTNIHLENFG